MIIGYARVSTDGQTLDAQCAALTAAGATQVFAEKVSGAVTDRKALALQYAALSRRWVLGMCCWSRGWIGWSARRGTSSTSWTRPPRPARGSGPSRMLGPTRQHRTGG